MGASIGVHAYSGKGSSEFKKHYKAVEFCIENKLSYPKETSEFFKGKIDGGSLEDFDTKWLLEKIKDGIEVRLPITKNSDYNEIRVKVSDIPKEVDELVMRLY